MPDAKPWEEFAASAPEKGPWDEFRPPKSLPEKARESGFAETAVGELGRLIRGVPEVAKTALALSPPGLLVRGPEKTTETVKGLGEIVAAPAREFAGKPQPGEREPYALPFSARLPMAIGTFLGGNPTLARERLKAGDPGGAWAAMSTIPLLNLVGGEIFRVAKGKRLAPSETRVAKATTATGAAPSVDVPKAFETSLPRLDRAVRDLGGPPKNPQDISPKWLFDVTERALLTAENEFNGNLQRIASGEVRAQSVADAIRAKKTRSTDPDALAYNKTLEERALDFERPRTWADLDATRRRYFENVKKPEVDALLQRGDANLAADRAAESELKSLVYGAVEKATPNAPPAYFRNLKAQEASLIRLKEQLRSRIIQLSNADAISRGTPWYMKEGISFYGHPEKLAGGISLHGLQRTFAGSPEVASSRALGKAFRPAPVVSRGRQAEAAALLGRVPAAPTSTPVPTPAQAPAPSPERQAKSTPFATPNNNNPGNLKTPSGDFKRFETPEAGWRGLFDYLKRASSGEHKLYSPKMSLVEFFRVYAPKSDQNNPEAYASYVAGKLGVPVSTSIRSLAGRLPEWARAINQVEWGKAATEIPEGVTGE